MKLSSEDNDRPIDINTINSSLVRFLLLLKDTISFHWKVTVELIDEQPDEVQKLHEYLKRWQGFVWSLIKLDELFIPLTKTVDKVYQILYPGYPCYPVFSILRFWIRIWYKEVYQSLQFMIETSMVEFLKSFHKGWREYSREKRNLKGKFTKNKCSLSDYFPDRRGHSPLFASIQSQSISPMLKSNNLIRTPKPQPMKNERIIEFEDGQHSIIDLDLLYGEEPKTNIPGFDRSQKEIFKQILVDMMDLSLNEYSIHYVCHTEAKFGKPFNSLRTKVSEQLKNFYGYSVEHMPFALWKDVVAEHYQILINILPLCLKKELVDYRTKFTRIYVRSRIERNLREFDKLKSKKGSKEEQKYQVFSTQASDNDPTIMTEDEYTEIIVSDVLQSPFHDFLNDLVNSCKSKKALVIAFMAYIKNQEPELISTFNEWFQINKDFYKMANLKNRTIENYKKPRGFPLELGHKETYLFSFDNQEISFAELKRMKEEREHEEISQKATVVRRRDKFASEDSFFDSWDDEMDNSNTLENLKPIRKKTTLKPLENGKLGDINQQYFISDSKY